MSCEEDREHWQSEPNHCVHRPRPGHRSQRSSPVSSKSTNPSGCAFFATTHAGRVDPRLSSGSALNLLQQKPLGEDLVAKQSIGFTQTRWIIAACSLSSGQQQEPDSGLQQSLGGVVTPLVVFVCSGDRTLPLSATNGLASASGIGGFGDSK